MSLGPGDGLPGLLVSAKKLIELTGDRFRCFSTRIQIQVSVTLSGCQLRMPEEAGQHRQSQTQPHGGAGEGVAEIVDTHVRYAGGEA